MNFPTDLEIRIESCERRLKELRSKRDFTLGDLLDAIDLKKGIEEMNDFAYQIERRKEGD